MEKIKVQVCLNIWQCDPFRNLFSIDINNFSDCNILVKLVEENNNTFSFFINNTPFALLGNQQTDIYSVQNKYQTALLIDRDDISGIEKLINLKQLKISSNHIQNIDSLNTLSQLTSLDLSYCKDLLNIDGLQGSTRLTTLNLSGCEALQNINGIKDHTGMVALLLEGCNSLQSIDSLQNLKGLICLDLSSCSSIQNIDALKNLTSLTSLDLYECNSLQNIDGLENITGLTYFSGLRNCDSLQNTTSSPQE